VSNSISAIILAAGESKRMGKPKQLLPLGESTILGKTVANFLASQVSEVIVVVGYQAEKIKALLHSKPVKIVLNPEYQQGMSTSISAGLKSIDDKAQGIMLVLADQPFIDSRTINRIIAGFNAGGKGIAVPCYQGNRGHPVIFARKYEGELAALKGDVGGKEVIARHPDDFMEISVDSDGVIADIDTLDGYKSQRAKFTQ
jgi:molybdenum cofactor cytidylyltransferase